MRLMIKEFAEKNNLPFKVSSVPEILLLNYGITKRFSAANPNTPGNGPSSPIEAKKNK